VVRVFKTQTFTAVNFSFVVIDAYMDMEFSVSEETEVKQLFSAYWQ